MSILIRLISLLVPINARPRWREEWLAEIEHGGWRIISGALPDALAMRRLARTTEMTARRPGLFHALDQDVRYALRTFGTGKSFTIAVIGSLAIGIAATTAAFALVNAAFFRPFAGVQEQDELVHVKIGRPGVWISTTWDEFELLKRGLTTLEDVAASQGTDFAVTAGAGAPAESVAGALVSGNYFGLLGARPALGRFFLSDEDGTPWARPAAVISHRFWQEQLAGDPAVTQRTLIVNGAILPIVGVAPEGFVRVPFHESVDVWTTFAVSDLVFRDRDRRPVHVRHAGPVRMDLVGRLRPSVTVEQAAAEAAVTAEGIVAARGRRIMKDAAARVEPLWMNDAANYALRSIASMAVPLIVLAIACVNAGNLLLARATRRSTDWLVRLALGASRWRLVRQLLVESLLLALGGAVVGLVVCYWFVALSRREFGIVAPSLEILVDARVLLFALLAAIATSLVFGLGPALSVTRAAISRAPEAGRFMRGPFGSRTRSALVMLQAALCLGLLATGAQFTNTLRKTLADDNLKAPAHTLITSLDVDKLRFTETETQSFYAELLERVQQLPGVRSAGLTGGAEYLMGGLDGQIVRVWRPGEGSEARRTEIGLYAGGEFFQTLDLPILRGRSFSAHERKGAPSVVVVNQAFADSISADDPLGKTIRVAASSDDFAAAVDAVIIGVVPSPVYAKGHTHPIVYLPAPIAPQPAMTLLVRFEGGAAGITTAVRSAVAATDNRVPITRMATGEQLRERRNVLESGLAASISFLGVLALILASAGLYGVVSYMVTMRRKEIGIRMALGAEGASVLQLVVRQSILPVIAGCVLGATGAVIVGMVLRSRLYGVSPMDPVAFGSATLLLLITMIVACLGPATRAARLNPVDTLRTE